MAVLSCIALCAACDGGSPSAGVAGNTEVELLISDPALEPDELAFWIDFVSYRITCPSTLLAPYDDGVDVEGSFEVVEAANGDPPVWTLVTDLPLSTCTIALWVFYDDEIVCSGSEMLPIIPAIDPSAPNKANIVLECSLSVNLPRGAADVDGSFDFIHGNYCPQLVWLGAVPSVVDAAVPAVTRVRTYSFDPDLGCGDNCDPKTCDLNVHPPVCTPGQDNGFTSTLIAPAGHGTFDNANAFDTFYNCDPLFPGPTEICVVASDGANECDRMRCTTVVCPDLCEGGCADDGKECTWDRCDPLTGLCSYPNAPVGIACGNCANTCAADGMCDGPAFQGDFVADDSTVFISSDVQLSYSATFVNPYSGASMSVMGDFRVNNSTYLGIGTTDVDMSGDITDVLSGLATGGSRSEILLIQDLVHPQTVCGIEMVTALNGFDVMLLADDYIMLQDMVIEGGNDMDRVWGNAGNDTLRGHNGPDLLDGGPGDDIIEGGFGDDTITLWPGSGFDSISGGVGSGDRVEIDAIQSQLLITPAPILSGYEFDIFYLGTPMAQIREVELLVMNDALIDFATCTGGIDDVCNLCGNDALNGDEGCDDGNNTNGDGCAADCVAEY